MYGFKPRHAQGQPVQNLADGGVVHSITGMLGMRKKTPEEMRASDAAAQARNKEAAARVAERNKTAEQPAAPAAKAISEYSGMSAMQRREKEQGLKDGGMVKPRGFKAGGMIHGPGTGTSDSIETEKLPGTFIMPADSTQAIGPAALGKMGEKMPVRLSNGEFEIPPEQVQALGEAVLTVMRNATHQGAGGAKTPPAAKGFMPRQHFAAGGAVKDEEQQRLANQTAMYVRGAQEAAANRPPEAPANQLTAQPTAKPIAAAPQPSTSPSGLYMQDRAQELREQAGAGNYAQAAGTAARTAVQGLGMYGIEMADKLASPVVHTAAGFGRGLIGDTNNAQKPSAAPGPMAAKPEPAPMTAATAVAHPVAPPAQPQATASTATAAPSDGEQIAPGVYKNAPGQYSDSASGMGTPAGFAGKPSAQNMAAADNLAQRNSNAPAPVAAGLPGVTAPTVRNTSNDWAARNNLRNLEVSASSITNQPSFGRGGRGYVPPAAAAYQAALQTDAALQQAQPGADIAAMRENAGIQREGMQQTGANTRTGMQEQGSNARDAGRTALARDDFGLRKEAAGFQTRAAARLEGLQTRYEAEADPAKQAVLARQIRELQGKEQPARYKVAAGGQQIDANGVAYRVPDRVFNEQTGKFSDGTGAAPAPQAPPKSGEVRNGFRFKGGNPNDQANWAKV
jgi:hypothetical protein